MNRRTFFGMLVGLPLALKAVVLAVRAPWTPTKRIKAKSDNVSLDEYSARIAKNGTMWREDHAEKYRRLRRPSLPERLGETPPRTGKISTVRILY